MEGGNPTVIVSISCLLRAEVPHLQWTFSHRTADGHGIVSKSVRKPAARLTLFQDSSRCQVVGKQRDDKYLESFESIEQNVKSVNLRLGSVRRSLRDGRGWEPSIPLLSAFIRA